MWKKLKDLHASNGWIVLALFVTGIALFLPSLRGPLAEYRVSLKNIHIFIGFFSIMVFLAYIPLLKKHWKTVRKQTEKKVNLFFTLLSLLVWIVSGLVLTFEGYMSANLSNTALLVHDVFTWLCLPVILYHVITRLRWVRRQKALSEEEKIPFSIPLSRRGFFKVTLGTLLVIIIGPSFYKWLKKFADDGGMAFNEVLEKTKKNKMNPLPVPAPESNPPIGGGLKGNFRAYTVAQIPFYTEDNWYLQIDGLVDYPYIFTWREFIDLKREVQVSDFHCVTGWSVNSVTYEGVPLKRLLEKAGVQTKGRYVKFYSGDGVYTDALGLDQANMDDVMVAVLMDGHLIPSEYGGPTRLIVPKMYAYKAVKWLVRIEVIEEPHLGYWQLRGYDTDAWVKK